VAEIKAFELDALERDQADGPAYREFLRLPGASLGLYLLRPDGADKQHPHDTDEVYVVLGGKAGLRIGDTDHELQRGSVICVDRGKEHRFHDITEDLRVLVIFAPPEPGS